MEAFDFIAISAAVFFASLVQSTTGFGFALFAVPLMTFSISTEQAVVISATMGTLTSGMQFRAERAHCDIPTVKRMLIAAAVGAPFGLLIILYLTSTQLKLMLAGVIVIFLFISVKGITISRGGRQVDFTAGFLSGMLNTSLSTNGPPLAMAMHAQQFPANVFRGTISAVFLGSGIITLILFAVTAHFDTEVGIAIAVALPSAAVGYFAGSLIRHRVGESAFRRIVIILLAITAVVTVFNALR